MDGVASLPEDKLRVRGQISPGTADGHSDLSAQDSPSSLAEKVKGLSLDVSLDDDLRNLDTPGRRTSVHAWDDSTIGDEWEGMNGQDLPSFPICSPSMPIELPRESESPRFSALLKATSGLRLGSPIHPRSGLKVTHLSPQDQTRQVTAMWADAKLRGSMSEGPNAKWRSRLPTSTAAAVVLEALAAKFDAAKAEVDLELKVFAKDIDKSLKKAALARDAEQGESNQASRDGKTRTDKSRFGLEAQARSRQSLGEDPESASTPGQGERTPGSASSMFGETSPIAIPPPIATKGEAPGRSPFNKASQKDMDLKEDDVQELLGIVAQCQSMSSADFRNECEAIVHQIDQNRQKLPVGPLKQLHTRLLFILTRCTRLLQFQKENLGVTSPTAEDEPPGFGTHAKGKGLSAALEVKLERTWTTKHKHKSEDTRTGLSKGARTSSLPVSSEIPADWLHQPKPRASPLPEVKEESPRPPENEDEKRESLDVFSVVEKVRAWRRTTEQTLRASKDRVALPSVQESEGGWEEDEEEKAEGPSTETGQQEHLTKLSEEGVRTAWEDVESTPSRLFKKVICRICEQKVPSGRLEIHSRLCAMADRADSKSYILDDRLRRLAHDLEKIAQIEHEAQRVEQDEEAGYSDRYSDEEESYAESSGAVSSPTVHPTSPYRAPAPSNLGVPSILSEPSVSGSNGTPECDSQEALLSAKGWGVSFLQVALKEGAFSNTPSSSADEGQEQSHPLRRTGSLKTAPLTEPVEIPMTRRLSDSKVAELAEASSPRKNRVHFAESDKGGEAAPSSEPSVKTEQPQAETTGTGLLKASSKRPGRKGRHSVAKQGTIAPQNGGLFSPARDSFSPPARVSTWEERKQAWEDAAQGKKPLETATCHTEILDSSPEPSPTSTTVHHKPFLTVGTQSTKYPRPLLVKNSPLRGTPRMAEFTIAQIEELADIARCGADVHKLEEDAEEQVWLCMQDLHDILEQGLIRDGEEGLELLVLVVETFGLRIDALLKEKHALLRPVELHEHASTCDAASIDDEWGGYDEESIAGSARNGLATPSRDRTSIDDFEIIRPISRGAYGRVFLARKRTTGDNYAIKVLKKADMIRKNLVESVKAERNILMQARNPFVIRFFYSFTSRENLYLVMEYANGGDAYSLLRNLGRLPEPLAKRYTAETVLALEYLHKQGVVHRDLKPDNLLIAHDGHIKLADFGLSKVGLINSTDELAASSRGPADDSPAAGSDESPSLETPNQRRKKGEAVGTPDYLAPEILLGTGHSAAADWWSLGCILYEFLVGVPPFNADTPQGIFDNILNRSLVWPDVPEQMSYEAQNLIDRLISSDPKARLGAGGAHEVKEHPFFADMDWETLPWQKALFVPAAASAQDTRYFAPRPNAGGPMDTGGAVPGANAEFDSSSEYSSTSRSDSLSEIGNEEGDECRDLADFQGTPSAKFFAGFSFKNLSQLEAINYDLARNDEEEENAL